VRKQKMFREHLTTLLPHLTSRPRILLRPAEPDYGGQERGALHNADVGEVGSMRTKYEP